MTSTWQQLGQRASFANRISTLFDRHRANSQAASSVRATTTFEVPLFLSPSRYEPPRSREEDYEHEETRSRSRSRSRSSTQSLIESVASIADRIRPITLPTSSRYSSPASSPIIPQPSFLPVHEPSLTSNATSSQSSRTDHQAVKDVQQRRRRKRRNALRVKVAAKKRIGIVFGITLFLTLIIYLVLAATGTAAGIMFHVLMILLVLILTAVFAHSTIRFFMLRKHVKARKPGRRHVGEWHGQPRQTDRSFFGEVQPNMVDRAEDLIPEKPIRIIMREDVETGIDEGVEQQTPLRQPPPVYGNFRSSKRINPDLVHWQHLPPSPLTPTYDEAMMDVHRVVGYRPPSYTDSDSGATHIVERGRQDVERALENIHPLERARMVNLKHNMI